MSERPGEKIGGHLKNEDLIDRWLAAQAKSLHQTLEEYKLLVAGELYRTQRLLARTTEERDQLVREVLKLKVTIAKIKETLND